MGCLVCGIFLQSNLNRTSIRDIEGDFQSDFISHSLRKEDTSTLRSEPLNPASHDIPVVITTSTNSNEKSTTAASSSNKRDTFPSTSNALLVNQRILIALASFDFSQFPLLEEVLDGYHGLSIAGAHVDLVIHTTVPYTVALLDLLNTRFGNCDGGFCITIVVVSPAIRLNLVDLHRKLFYDKIQEYDLFLYSEDDILVTPTTVAAYLTETKRLEQLTSKSPASDYNVGIVRYEYNYPPDVIIDDKSRHATQNVTRVYWEHLWRPLIPKSMSNVQTIGKARDAQPPAPKEIQERYVQMDNHHMGMFMATRDLLLAWKKREGCDFDVARRRPGLKNNPGQPTEGTQRVWMSSNMLHGGKHCNVQQVIPMETFGQFTVWHLPNKNYRRVGKKGRIGGDGSSIENEFGTGNERFAGPDSSLPSAMEYHLGMRKAYPVLKREGEYNGIRMENEADWRGHFKGKDKHVGMVNQRMKSYEAYVGRGGIMLDGDFKAWDWRMS